MADVFVSYKTEDRRRVQPLVDALQADGYSVWWDQEIGGGAVWRHTIETELKAAKCVVVAWTKRSIGPYGGFVHDEASRAQKRRIYLPITIDRVDPPLGFGEVQAVPLVAWNGQRSDRRYQTLLACVRAIIEHGPRPPVGRTEAGRETNWNVVASGAAGIIAIAAFGLLLRKPRVAEISDSIAVLPFDNLSGDPGQAYFSDGMAEELRSALSRIPQLKVVGRTSSEAVRDEDARTAARKLGVTNILTGSVRRSESLIRVSADLVDGKSGVERWSEDFDYPVGDILTIQSSIAQRVAEALRIRLAEPTQQALVRGGTRNPEAHDLFLKALAGVANDTPAGLQQAIADLDAATQFDPGYAQALALKARTLAFYSSNYDRDPVQLAKHTEEAAATAKRAIKLAPDSAWAHSALSQAYRQQLRFRLALEEIETAVALPGADAVSQIALAMTLSCIGRSDDAQEAAARAVSLDPLNPKTFSSQSFVLYLARQYAAAIAAAQKSLGLESSGEFARAVLVHALIMVARYDEATAELANLRPDTWAALTARSIIADRTGDTKGSEQALRQLRAIWGDSANSNYAQIYAQRGDSNTAIQYLKNASEQRNSWFVFVAADPMLDPIRSDPRFEKIIRALDLPE